METVKWIAAGAGGLIAAAGALLLGINKARRGAIKEREGEEAKSALKTAEEAHNWQVEAGAITDEELDARNSRWLNKNKKD